ncbi:malate transporter, partial [Salmonella enterica]|nr:malate transporter [Salmonella enterica]EJI1261280.1 malate transporter [Salmonella enterica]EKH0962672.1 malate transporter [Salmonella enterica]EKK5204045.1 malate transporter [Salmonella enterica]EKM0276413.1 malate transporter [Salmonella enterica]
MKLSMTVEADTINVRALNGGRIVVDIDGIELASLIDVVCDNG